MQYALEFQSNHVQ